jgi:hypothetical protein
VEEGKVNCSRTGTGSRGNNPPDVVKQTKNGQKMSLMCLFGVGLKGQQVRGAGISGASAAPGTHDDATIETDKWRQCTSVQLKRSNPRPIRVAFLHLHGQADVKVLLCAVCDGEDFLNLMFHAWRRGGRLTPKERTDWKDVG